MGESEEQKSSIRKNWKDYFDVFKYFIPFFVYFIIVWLDNNYASNDELANVALQVSDNTRLAERAIEGTDDLRNDLTYEVKIINEKLENIIDNVQDVKKIVEENH